MFKKFIEYLLEGEEVERVKEIHKAEKERLDQKHENELARAREVDFEAEQQKKEQELARKKSEIKPA